MGKQQLKGIKKPFAIFFFSALLLWLVSEILIAGNQIKPIPIFLFWLSILIVEVIGVARKSPKEMGDTLSECLWIMSSGYRSRQIMTSILGVGIGFRIISFGFLNWANSPEYGVFKHDLFNYGALVLWGIGFCCWIIPHFLYSGERG